MRQLFSQHGRIDERISLAKRQKNNQNLREEVNSMSDNISFLAKGLKDLCTAQDGTQAQTFTCSGNFWKVKHVVRVLMKRHRAPVNLHSPVSVLELIVIGRVNVPQHIHKKECDSVREPLSDGKYADLDDHADAKVQSLLAGVPDDSSDVLRGRPEKLGGPGKEELEK